MQELDAILRSHLQYQGEVASYVFSGSEPGMMRQLFERKDRPLYGSAVPMRLERLRDEDIAPYVRASASQSGPRGRRRARPAAADRAGAPAARDPPRPPALGRGRPTARPRSSRTGSAAHAAALLELQPEFDAHWRALPTSEQKALRAVIAGQGSPFKGDVLRRLALDKTTAHNAVQRLIASGDVEVVERRHAIIDPLFAEWVGAIAAGARLSAGVESSAVAERRATSSSSRSTRASSSSTRSSCGRRRGRRPGRGSAPLRRLAAEQLRVALLLLARPARQARDQLAFDQPLETRPRRRRARRTGRAARVRPFSSPGVCGPRSISTREQRQLGGRELERLVEQVPVLRDAAARPTREPRPALRARRSSAARIVGSS